ncbi:AMP-binding protein [Leptospira sp. GIMC2001]|uniref:AMP-binding protein n=1 Tax=Leptospira sp. GIMC2001 TaxID=1513297 RepID=UPI00234BDE3D|nr:AMP-binding protein [Leptospira sp. GIMC2001]WCL47819.1 AMP-binding protein [Leptospira sp. GIMC2001]
MENSKLELSKLDNSNLVFYKSDRDFFREGYFHLSILREETPVLIDPNLVQFWIHQLNVEILTIQDIEPPNKTELERIFTNGNLLPLSEIGDYNLYFATSGSTGEPKLICKSDREIGSEVEFLIPFLQKKYNRSFFNSEFLVTIPIFHVYGFIWGFALPLELRSKILDSESLSSMRRILKEFSPEVWITVPSILSSLMELESLTNVNQGSNPNSEYQPLIVSSGSAMSDETLTKLIENNFKNIIEIYGSTETGGIGFREPSESKWIEKFACHKIQSIDDCLVIQSKFIHPTIALDDSGHFHTQDIIELDGDKFLYKGRKDRIVKIHAKRIHLDIVEKEIQSMEGVLDVIVVPTESNGDLEISALIHKNNSIEDLDWSHIPKYFLPTRIKYLDELPYLPNGKKDYEKTKRFFD